MTALTHSSNSSSPSRRVSAAAPPSQRSSSSCLSNSFTTSSSTSSAYTAQEAAVATCAPSTQPIVAAASATCIDASRVAELIRQLAETRLECREQRQRAERESRRLRRVQRRGREGAEETARRPYRATGGGAVSEESAQALNGSKVDSATWTPAASTLNKACTHTAPAVHSCATQALSVDSNKDDNHHDHGDTSEGNVTRATLCGQCALRVSHKRLSSASRAHDANLYTICTNAPPPPHTDEAMRMQLILQQKDEEVHRWRRRCAALRRRYTRSLARRDAALRELQLLVENIHMEHDRNLLQRDNANLQERLRGGVPVWPNRTASHTPPKSRDANVPSWDLENGGGGSGSTHVDRSVTHRNDSVLAGVDGSHREDHRSANSHTYNITGRRSYHPFRMLADNAATPNQQMHRLHEHSIHRTPHSVCTLRTKVPFHPEHQQQSFDALAEVGAANAVRDADAVGDDDDADAASAAWRALVHEREVWRRRCHELLKHAGLTQNKNAVHARESDTYNRSPPPRSHAAPVRLYASASTLSSFRNDDNTCSMRKTAGRQDTIYGECGECARMPEAVQRHSIDNESNFDDDAHKDALYSLYRCANAKMATCDEGTDAVQTRLQHASLRTSPPHATPSTPKHQPACPGVPVCETRCVPDTKPIVGSTNIDMTALDDAYRGMSEQVDVWKQRATHLVRSLTPSATSTLPTASTASMNACERVDTECRGTDAAAMLDTVQASSSRAEKLLVPSLSSLSPSLSPGLPRCEEAESLSAERSAVREVLQRQIARHDQLLHAIRKVQTMASERTVRRPVM